VLDAHKETIDPLSGFTGTISGRQIVITPVSSNETVTRTPVLMETTFHDHWKRIDGKPIYAVTPFFMLVFIDRPLEIQFARDKLDLLALGVSTITLVGLLAAAVHIGLRRRRRVRKVYSLS
jgi:hypothetical protein